MSGWHGYEQHPDAHPERPWWRYSLPPGATDADVPGWWRMDGRGLYGFDRAGVRFAPWNDDASLDAALARIDAEHPLPAPPPKCGQVWVWPWNTEAMVTGVVMGAAQWGASLSRDDMRSWPPPGAVLVAGPHSPWAPAP